MQRKVFDRKVFNRKLVLITGGCAGIGRALAVRMAQAGARLVIFDLHQDVLDGLVQHLADHHNAEALGLCCDVSDAEAVQRAVTLVIERYGGIDVLVNNAGITHRSPVASTSLAVFQRVMAVNFYGALHCTQAALPSLIARDGQIIVLSSLSQYAPVPNRAAYNASKHALHGLFETLRGELSDTGVHVMLVCPVTPPPTCARTCWSATAPPHRRRCWTSAGSPRHRMSPRRSTRRAASAPAAGALNLDWKARLLARWCPRLYQQLLLPRLLGSRT